MKTGWRELSRIIGYILLFGIIAYNLWVGESIVTSVFRGVVAWLAFSIVNIIVTNILVRLLNEYEMKRLKELAEEEERREQEMAAQAAEQEEEAAESSEPKPKAKRETAE